MISIAIYAQDISIYIRTGDGSWQSLVDLEVLAFSADPDFELVERDEADPELWYRVVGRYGGEPTLRAWLSEATWSDDSRGRFVVRRGRRLDAAAVAYLIRHDKPGVSRIDRSVPPDRASVPFPTDLAPRPAQQPRLAVGW